MYSAVVVRPIHIWHQKVKPVAMLGLVIAWKNIYVNSPEAFLLFYKYYTLFIETLLTKENDTDLKYYDCNVVKGNSATK